MSSFMDTADLVKSLDGILILKSGQRTPSDMSMNGMEEDTDDCSPEACSPPEDSLSIHHPLSSSIQTIEELSGVVSYPDHDDNNEHYSTMNSSKSQSQDSRRDNHLIMDTLTNTSGIQSRLSEKEKSRRVIFPVIHIDPSGDGDTKDDQNSDTSPNSALFRSQSANALQNGEDIEKVSLTWVPIPTSPEPKRSTINMISINVKKMNIPPFQTSKTNSNTITSTNHHHIASKIESKIPPMQSTSTNSATKQKLLLVPPSFPPHNNQLLPKSVVMTEPSNKKPNPSILRSGKYSIHLSKRASQLSMFKTDNSEKDEGILGTSCTSSPRRNRSASCAVDILSPMNHTMSKFPMSPKNALMRHTSIQLIDSRTTVRFDPRVWVHEFHRPKDENIWFTAAELDRFKYETMQRIQRWTRNNKNGLDFIPSGTGRIISSSSGLRTSGNMSAMRALFSNPALSYDTDDDDEEGYTKEGLDASPCVLIPDDVDKACEREFHSVLLVDSHDIFLNLLTKGIKSMLPHVRVTSAYTSDEAWKQIVIARNKDPMSEGGCPHGFDLIVVEERISFFPHHQIRDNSKWEISDTIQGQGVSLGSGSSLIKRIKEEEMLMRSSSTSWRKGYSSSLEPRFSLLIGISAHLSSDYKVLESSGADLIWGKPPPRMDAELKCKVLRAIMNKRQFITGGFPCYD